MAIIRDCRGKNGDINNNPLVCDFYEYRFLFEVNFEAALELSDRRQSKCHRKIPPGRLQRGKEMSKDGFYVTEIDPRLCFLGTVVDGVTCHACAFRQHLKQRQ